MNQNLTNVICQHILTQLGVIPSNINSESLLSNKYLTNHTLVLEDDGFDLTCPIWGAYLKISDQEIKLIATKLGSKDKIEYCLNVISNKFPSYGIYLNYDNYEPQDGLISVSPDNEGWMPCQIYLQATYLAAMEQTRDLGLVWYKLDEIKKEIEILKSFIHHREQLWDSEYER